MTDEQEKVKIQYNPLSINELPQPSPEEQRAIEIKGNNEIGKRLSRSQAVGPSVRQQSQSEIINLALLYRQLGGNPFSVRRIPFSVLRDMTTDAMVSFCWHYTVTPMVNADYIVISEDAQLAAAVDKAFRPINASLIMSFANAKYMGYAPMVKRWKLAPLKAKYRDRHSNEPNADKEVWDSNIEPLMPQSPISLAPENCIPRWDEYGQFYGFMYSPVPIPDPVLLGIAQTYGPNILSGYPIPLDFALWVVNEREQVYGSCYGAPTTRRCYRPWWSKWFRWAIADRAYEKKADPPVEVFYPTEVTEGFDPNDPNPESPTARSLEQKAITLGKNLRSGTVAAIPGDFMTNDEGKTTNQRMWEVKYLENNQNFEAFDKTFTALDLHIMRGMLLPEQAFVDSNVTGQGSSQRYVATQMGEIYQESQQTDIEDYDSYKNKYIVPQFIAANFPDKINTPCEIKTGNIGTKNDEFNKQLLTLIGQKEPERLEVNVRELLREYGTPLETTAEQKARLKEQAKNASKKEAKITAPTEKKSGTQGYNAGIEKTETGESVYFNGPEIINLSSATDFLGDLPDIPPYKNPSVRSASVRLRKLFVHRYKSQIKSFANRIRDKVTLQLAQQTDEEKRSKFGPGAAKIAAEAAVASWLGEQMADYPYVLESMRNILGRVTAAAGKHELKLANLDSSVYDPDQLGAWVDESTESNLQSIDHTLREQFIDFLINELQRTTSSDQIAKDFEEHFSETPETHADRISRFETGEAYNQGMIQAGLDAGISQVILHDASDGTNKDTDKFCLSRNGKVVSMDEARLQKKAHPGCTLYMTYLTTENLSIEISDLIPDYLNLDDDTPGAYDAKTETLYVRPEFKEDANKWTLALGEQLRMR
jgi:hypothetical protein